MSVAVSQIKRPYTNVHAFRISYPLRGSVDSALAGPYPQWGALRFSFLSACPHVKQTVELPAI